MEFGSKIMRPINLKTEVLGGTAERVIELSEDFPNTFNITDSGVIMNYPRDEVPIPPTIGDIMKKSGIFITFMEPVNPSSLLPIDLFVFENLVDLKEASLEISSAVRGRVSFKRSRRSISCSKASFLSLIEPKSVLDQLLR